MVADKWGRVSELLVNCEKNSISVFYGSRIFFPYFNLLCIKLLTDHIIMQETNTVTKVHSHGPIYLIKKFRCSICLHRGVIFGICTLITSWQQVFFLIYGRKVPLMSCEFPLALSLVT